MEALLASYQSSSEEEDKEEEQEDNNNTGSKSNNDNDANNKRKRNDDDDDGREKMVPTIEVTSSSSSTALTTRRKNHTEVDDDYDYDALNTSCILPPPRIGCSNGGDYTNEYRYDEFGNVLSLSSNDYVTIKQTSLLKKIRQQWKQKKQQIQQQASPQQNQLEQEHNQQKNHHYDQQQQQQQQQQEEQIFLAEQLRKEHGFQNPQLFHQIEQFVKQQQQQQQKGGAGGGGGEVRVDNQGENYEEENKTTSIQRIQVTSNHSISNTIDDGLLLHLEDWEYIHGLVRLEEKACRRGFL